MTRSLLLILLLASALPAAEGKPEPRLVPGKFGKALDALTTPLAFSGDSRYRTPPLTVECWAKLESKRGFNVLVSSDPRHLRAIGKSTLTPARGDSAPIYPAMSLRRSFRPSPFATVPGTMSR